MVENLTEKLAKAQNIDFVEQYGKGIKTLKQMLGIQRVIKMDAGTTLDTYKSKTTLASGTVGKGEVIPLSKVEVVKGAPIEIKWEKYRKAVPAEDIQKYGYNQAVTNTDGKLVRELQKELKKKFFTQLGTGEGTATGVGLKGALAQGWGKVQVAFEDESVQTIAFVNPLDVSDYLAKTNVTIQTAFGLTYVENVLGVQVAVMSASVPQGTAYVTASENLVLAFANISGGELGKAFDFTTDETGIIGVMHDVSKQSLTAETIALSGLVLFAERLDGVFKVTIQGAEAL